MITPLLSNLAPLVAQITEEQFIQAVRQGVGDPGDTRRLLALLLAVVGVGAVLVLLHFRRKRQVAPKPLCSPTKLAREIQRELGMSPAEMKRLRARADQLRTAGRPVGDPLVLLLCPSLSSDARPDNADARTDNRAGVD